MDQIFVQEIVVTFQSEVRFVIHLAVSGPKSVEAWTVVHKPRTLRALADLPRNYESAWEAFRAAVRFIAAYPGLKFEPLAEIRNPCGDQFVTVAEQRSVLEAHGLDMGINIVKPEQSA